MSIFTCFGEATQCLPNNSKNKHSNFGFTNDLCSQNDQENSLRWKVNIHFQTFPFVTFNNTTPGDRYSDDTSITEMQKLCALSSSGVVTYI